MKLDMWPTDEAELDYQSWTGGEFYPIEYPDPTFNSSAPMTPMDYSGTFPDTGTVSTSNNILGELPDFMKSAGNVLTQFGNLYNSVEQANRTHAGVVPPGSQLLTQTPTNNKAILPLGILAAILFLA